MSFFQRILTKHIKLLTLSVLMLVVGNAYSACAFLGSVKYQRQDINFGNIIIQRDAPIGSVLWSGSVSMNFVGGVVGGSGATTNGVRCTPARQQPSWQTFVNQIPYGGQTLLDVGVPGVALRFKAVNLSTGSYPRLMPENSGCAGSTSSDWCITSWGSGRTLELVKVADKTESGVMNNGAELLRMGFATDPLILSQVYIGPVSVVTTVACSVTTPAITVPMGRITLNDFSGSTKGSTSPEVPFNIGLDCNKDARVNVQLDATADSSAAPGVVALNQVTNSASGVGVQILRSSSPIILGSKMLVGTAATTGAFTIPFTARYYQTQDKISGGIANSSATFTLTYQ